MHYLEINMNMLKIIFKIVHLIKIYKLSIYGVYVYLIYLMDNLYIQYLKTNYFSHLIKNN